MEDEIPKHNHDREVDGDLLIRRLEVTDKSKGFLKVLSQLSPCDSISDSEFLTQFSLICSHGDDHVIAVVEDRKSGKIVATGSVFVEKKFIHGCSKVGHIEDVVVDRESRGKKLGQMVLNYLVEHAKKMDCYKVILDSLVDTAGFYKKNGFVEKDVHLVMYF
ncbi:Glucosamine 6-phosphate N-acetyltransferase [Zostera marina]|uniref:Glucosamine 6-phosphate N-acetyltransferase n=1 Tax=Zostera marina TaxID=29655 RepID=A0A0K9P0X7_ZOSMR|nr:Glucosamine 6-phosphate N-acetyltransferase [Zostera marina]